MSEGSIYQRKDKRWVAQWKDTAGKTRYLYRKSKAEAKKALRQALKDRDDGIIPASKMTVTDLLDGWLEGMQDTVSRRTWENRECVVRLHIKPAIGAQKLAKLSHKDLQGLYRAKLTEGLAPSTIKRMHTMLKLTGVGTESHHLFLIRT